MAIFENMNDEAKQMIEDFKDSYRAKFGGNIVVFAGSGRLKNNLSLNEIEDISISSIGEKISPKEKRHSRRKEVVAARQCYCKIAREMGYTYMEIGKHIKKDHSTIIHAVTRSNDMIETNDLVFTNIYNKIVNNISQALDGRSVSTNNQSGIKSKSTLPTVLNKK